MPVVQLIEALKRHDRVRSVHISLGRDSIALRNGSVHHPAAAGATEETLWPTT